MVAYSFKRQFVEPILLGLGASLELQPVYPKRQTIRADRKRHAHPGEQLQLFCGMRTKDCFLIGRAQCISVDPIRLWVGADFVGVLRKASVVNVTDEFAIADGFSGAKAMFGFWKHEHGPGWFDGVLIKWEPLR